MKKKILTFVTAAMMAVMMAVPAFAGQWLTGYNGFANGWYYKFDDASYPENRWMWLDANKDGVAECYYFDTNGWLVVGTTTPDGYQVNNDGAWTVNGVVQTRSYPDAEPAAKTTEEVAANSVDDSRAGDYAMDYSIDNDGSRYNYNGANIAHVKFDSNGNIVMRIDATYFSAEINESNPWETYTKIGEGVYRKGDNELTFNGNTMIQTTYFQGASGKSVCYYTKK